MTKTVLILGTYDACMQPLPVAALATRLLELDILHHIRDLWVQAIDPALLAEADAFVVAIPLHDALPLADRIARELRASHPDTPLIFFGAHAELNKPLLESRHGAYVATGNPIEAVPALLSAIGIAGNAAPVRLPRHTGRAKLPGLHRYSYPGGLLDGKVVGNVESVAGCRFACAHCTVYTLARGAFDLQPRDEILDEIGWLVDAGANHISFVDAEFMNEAEHGPALIEAMAARFPGLTFDVTSRVDRILKFEDEFRRFRDLGCAFVTTALEFPDDRVLRLLRKGYRTRDLAALAELNARGSVPINPTLIVFNPWVGVPEIEQGEHFLRETGLSNIIDPVQFVTRLMITKGSPLLETDMLNGIEMTERDFDFAWRHPLPEVDALYESRLSQLAGGSFSRCCVRC